MSVNRKVTVPEGRSRTAALMMRQKWLLPLVEADSVYAWREGRAAPLQRGRRKVRNVAYSLARSLQVTSLQEASLHETAAAERSDQETSVQETSLQLTTDQAALLHAASCQETAFQAGSLLAAAVQLIASNTRPPFGSGTRNWSSALFGF